MEDLKIGLIAISCLILALSLIGNIALSVVVFKQLLRQSTKNYSYLVLNLAVSDLLLALFSIPFDILQIFTQPVFPFGATMCKMLWPFQTICSMASIFTVGALSYQRYRYIVHPCKGKLSGRAFFVLLASIWFLPVIIAGVPYSFVLRMDKNTSQCIEWWVPVSKQAKLKLTFTVYLFTIQYVLPLALIVWCNVKAICTLKRYLKYRRRTSMLCTVPFKNHENAVKMLTVIMAVFALFWLPGQVMAILIEFQHDNSFIINYGSDIGYLFVFSNCVANPLIFAYFSNGRSKIVNFFKRPFEKNSTKTPEETLSKRVQLPLQIQPETNSDAESGNRLMRNFLELVKTMKEERLRIYLDGTPETVLN